MYVVTIIICMIIVIVNIFYEDFHQNEQKVPCRLLERGFGAQNKKPPEKSGYLKGGSVGLMLKTYPAACPANTRRLLWSSERQPLGQCLRDGFTSMRNMAFNTLLHLPTPTR